MPIPGALPGRRPRSGRLWGRCQRVNYRPFSKREPRVADKIVLSYSGGLDTSVICRWLQETYNAEVITFTADIGQGEEVEPARAKARSM